MTNGARPPTTIAKRFSRVIAHLIAPTITSAFSELIGDLFTGEKRLEQWMGEVERLKVVSVQIETFGLILRNGWNDEADTHIQEIHRSFSELQTAVDLTLIFLRHLSEDWAESRMVPASLKERDKRTLVGFHKKCCASIEAILLLCGAEEFDRPKSRFDEVNLHNETTKKEEDLWVSYTDIAERLRVSPDTVRRRLRTPIERQLIKPTFPMLPGTPENATKYFRYGDVLRIWNKFK